MEVSWGNRLKPGDYNTSAAFRTLFRDSDDTHTASVSYFAYVRLERR